MLSNVKSLIASCFPTINYNLQLMENLPPDLFMHLTLISYSHTDGKNSKAAWSCLKSLQMGMS